MERKDKEGNIQDCFGCRMVSGTGLLGIAAYVAYQARNNSHRGGRLTTYAISAVFGGIGAARILNVYPFNVTHESLKQV